MPVVVILGILGIAVIIGAIMAGVSSKSSEERIFGIVLSVGALIAGILFSLIASFYYVEARTLGIIVEFGKPVGTSGPGPSWAAPWKEVYHFPTSSQPLDYDNTDGSGSPAGVKFNGGTTGAVHVNLNWSVMSDDTAIKLWENWREFDRVTTNVVDPTVRSTIAVVLGKYNPEDAVKGENLPKLNAEIMDLANKELKPQGIQIERVLVKRVDPDAQAQARINEQNSKNAELKLKDTELEIANREREINEAKEKALTPQIIADRCLTILQNWDQSRQGPFPAWQPCTGVLPAIPR